jgi:hypothetical protein
MDGSGSLSGLFHNRFAFFAEVDEQQNTDCQKGKPIEKQTA